MLGTSSAQKGAESLFLALVAPTSPVSSQVGGGVGLVWRLWVPLSVLSDEFLLFLLSLLLFIVALSALFYDGGIVICSTQVVLDAMLLGVCGGRAGTRRRQRTGCRHCGLVDDVAGLLCLGFGLGALDGVWVVKGCLIT